jgi:uncharacterized protein (TIGR00255 family)
MDTAMIESMTGFGEGQADGPNLAFAATARSVNHRHLDPVIRLPEMLRRWEPGVLERVRETFERGRVELRIEAKAVGESPQQIRIRHDVLQSFHGAVERAREEGLLLGELSTGELLSLAGAIETRIEDVELDDLDVEAFELAVKGSLESLKLSRREEGRRLGGALEQVLADLGKVVDRLDAVREGLQQDLAERFRARIDRLLGEREIDPDRMALEVALLSEKGEIQEELDRLRSHLESVGGLLGGETSVGRRMEFLCQEILRELNTIGSKCRDTGAVELVLDGKAACEKLREQAQNLQ